MKILVTGGAGFIGSHIVDKLVFLGHNVVCVDNFLTGSKDNLNPNSKFYEVDITNLEELEKIFAKEKFDYVFHTAAGYLVQSLKNPQRDASINIIGSINVCELCLKYKIKKLIYSHSGGASYGDPQYCPIKEDHSMNPTTPYGISKHTVEHYLFMYNKNYGLKYTSLRYANIYGPRQNPLLEGGVVSVFLDPLLRGESPVMKSDGTPTRDYCYVGDVVEANISVMNKGDNNCYNIGTGKETSVLELYRTMQKVIGTHIEFTIGEPRIGDVQRCSLDISKIKKEVGWEPKVDLSEGIRRTAEWIKNEFHKNQVIMNNSNKIQALILAAGVGERMRPLTDNTPKPMLPIAGKPLLQYTIELFKKYKITNIGITTYYLKERIIDYFKDGNTYGVNITYLEEKELIPSARAIKQMEDKLDDTFVIINGDNLTNINLNKIKSFHKEKNADITIVSYLRDQNARPSSQLDFDANNKLLRYREKMMEEEMKQIPPDKRFANMGVYVFNKNVIGGISNNEKRDLGHLFSDLLDNFNLYVYNLEEGVYFKEVGKIDRYYQAKEELECGKVNL